jgi:hypothetical protein
VAEAMEPVSVSAKSETMAKVKTKIIMAAPTFYFGTPPAKDDLVFSMD